MENGFCFAGCGYYGINCEQMKAIIIKGCKDCPYSEYVKQSNKWVCAKHFATFETPPETPHPDCKLNDLPNVRMVEFEAYSDNINIPTANGFINGANFVIEQITK